MDILDKIKKLQNANGWSYYRLAKESGLSDSTIKNMYTRNTIPNIFTLEAICGAFGITLSQFFFDEEKDALQLTPELKYLFDGWMDLSNENKELVLNLIKALR